MIRREKGLSGVLFIEIGLQAGAVEFAAPARILAAILPDTTGFSFASSRDELSLSNTITSKDSFEKLILSVVLRKRRHFSICVAF